MELLFQQAIRIVLPYTNSLLGCPASFLAVLAALPATRPPEYFRWAHTSLRTHPGGDL
ncbi:MAG: hypothetical protein KJ578_04040 [Bacteroidetes bacterium]|nr:hypothetical protein [Bacteroidota bacterium]